jgi:hypothetical protein
VASYERGHRYSSRAIFKLAAALNVEAQWLAIGKGAMGRTKETWQSRVSVETDYALKETPVALPSSPACAAANEWLSFCIPRGHYAQLTSHHKLVLERLVEAFIGACQTTEDASCFKRNVPGATNL